MHTIILSEPKRYSSKAIATLEKIGKVYPWRKDKLGSADVLVVKLNRKISKKVLDDFPNLKIIATSTTGLNHIDCDEAKRRGIKIVSLRGEAKFLKTITPTAEETIGLMIALMRKIPWAFESVKRGEWQREKYYGNELYGRTLGIIGFGRLGRIVARYARCFGMRVIAADPFVSSLAMRQVGVKKVMIDNVFQKADVVSLHVLLTPKTENMVIARHFGLMKPHAYFINTARGELIDEDALLKALREKRIAGAALDVLRGENPSGDHVGRSGLARYAKGNDNLLIVPHLGGASFDAMARTEEFIAEKVLQEVNSKAKNQNAKLQRKMQKS